MDALQSVSVVRDCTFFTIIISFKSFYFLFYHTTVLFSPASKYILRPKYYIFVFVGESVSVLGGSWGDFVLVSNIFTLFAFLEEPELNTVN